MRQPYVQAIAPYRKWTIHFSKCTEKMRPDEPTTSMREVLNVKEFHHGKNANVGVFHKRRLVHGPLFLRDLHISTRFFVRAANEWLISERGRSVLGSGC